MDQMTIQILFALLRSAICGTKLTEKEQSGISEDSLRELMKIASAHDVGHLFALGIKQNELVADNPDIEKSILKAVYRYERINYEYEMLCRSLEKAQIPFVPLKGSVIRAYYPEPWMRTSCDIDILVQHKDLDTAVLYLEKDLNYTEKERATHDVTLFSPSGNCIELHFDLVEEGRANNAIGVLGSVWENVLLHKDSNYWYEMTDEFFYFYHIAHMAKHFENGGCGLRPFIDLFILDRQKGTNQSKRDEVLAQGDLLQFANVSRKLSAVWFGNEKADELSLQMQSFILRGGLYGSSNNRVALLQKKKGGQLGYMLSRVFIPYAKLKRYYPILEKHAYLAPIMQVRRWFMLLNPDVAKMAKKEIKTNITIEKSQTDELNTFLNNIGL